MPNITTGPIADLVDVITESVKGSETNGQAWPQDAAFALELRYCAWPVGWSAERHVDFFKTREELDNAVAALQWYAELEDNYVAYQGYYWDWGPVPLDDVECQLENL